jgi:DNA-binding NarL/FixJ family response regulator
VTGPVRVLIVDDDALVRAGLRTMLGGAAGIEVIGEAADGTEILRTLDHHRADVILLDVRMPKLDGLGAPELVRSQPSPPAVLMLTTFDTDDHVLRALRGGAAGFLVKDTPASGDRSSDRACRGRRKHALSERHAPADQSAR